MALLIAIELLIEIENFPLNFEESQQFFEEQFFVNFRIITSKSKHDDNRQRGLGKYFWRFSFLD